jgi:cystathionine gamma-synthase
MAAVDLVLCRLQPDDLIVAPHDCYSGSYRLISMRAAKRQFRAMFVDQSDRQALQTALAAKPKLLLVETPSNPLMRVVDIAQICAEAKTVGATVAVDNTFLSPALQTPLALGADFVIHSTTKYLNGHSDVVGGAVVAARQSDNEELAFWANVTGVTGSPFDCYQTLRGIRSLFPRIERQQSTAAAIAQFLADHKQVGAVYYPGLPTDPGHQIARAQQRGFGAMLSFELLGGREAMRRFVESLKILILAESLGGVESLIAHPATMTHVGMGPEARAVAGIKDSLLRLSIGLESKDDLINDLGLALTAAAGVR